MDNIENVLWGSNEVYHIYNLFYEINPQDFLLVFKDALKFIVNGKINIKFALSKLLLDLGIPVAQTLGLNKLFEMLNCDEERLQILELYNYNDVSYKKDETMYSPFVLSNWASNLTIYKAKLYFDFGNGFNEKDVIIRDFITDIDGKFCVDFNNIKSLCENKKLLGLRFDPCEFCSKVKIQNITSSGNNLSFEVNKNNFSEDQYAQYDKYDIFYINDPSYIINNFEPSTNDLSISGEISNLKTSDVINLKDLELNKMEEKINDINNELLGIQSTFSWKVTKPLRFIKKHLIK